MQSFAQKLGTFLTILVGIVAVFALGAFLPKITPVNEWAGGWYTFRVVTSGSMEPAISTGDLVVTWPTGNYAVGDVVTFGDIRASGGLTTHRVIEKTQQGGEPVYATKGDANEERDFQSVSQSEIDGEVFLTVPYAGYIAAYAQSPRGVTTLGVFFIAVFALWGWYDHREKKRKNHEKTEETKQKES